MNRIYTEGISGDLKRGRCGRLSGNLKRVLRTKNDKKGNGDWGYSVGGRGVRLGEVWKSVEPVVYSRAKKWVNLQ